MKKTRVLCGLLLLLALICAQFAACAELPLLTLEPTMPPSDLHEAKVTKSKRDEDGQVRVLLKSLGSPVQLTLTLDGNYSIENDAGFRFDRGTHIALTAAEGKVYLLVGGLRMDMGSSLTLTRAKVNEGEENGIRIHETGRNTLYQGDLAVSAEENSLRAVLTIDMEDYLCGVIAYEMSDSWPLEALKAQAVAARTYALQRIHSAGSRDYDIVDTTADQVYRGYNAEYSTVERAISETRGIVGTYKGGIATCYYTASNGGETALPSDVWSGDGDFGYLSRTYDPYDLENSNSIVNSISFAPGADDLPALRSMLQTKLMQAAPEYPDIELQEILFITPENPVTEGSIMCRDLRFTVRASATVTMPMPKENDPGAPMEKTDSVGANLALYGIDGIRRILQNAPYETSTKRVSLPQNYELTLSVYDDIKDGLGLSINGSDCEIVSVEQGIFGYSIALRRFGHGVGMSQRGAQRMAGGHNMNYLQILGFYYPSMTLEEITWKTPELPTLDALPDSVGRARPEPTPRPTPAPLPELKKGEKYARVQLGDESSTMNLREQAGTIYPVVTSLSNKQRVIVSGEADADGWIAVHTAEYSGYAKLEYLIIE